MASAGSREGYGCRGDGGGIVKKAYPPRGAFATRPPTDAVAAGGEVGEITALDRPRFVEELELGVPHTREQPCDSVPSELFDYLFERLLQTRRRYEALTSEQADAIESAYRDGPRSAVVEAHFGARIAALEELHAELRRIRSKDSSGVEG